MLFCDRLQNVIPDCIRFFNTCNTAVEVEIYLYRPPCELVISGKGLIGITTSLLSLGSWVVGQNGELTYHYYMVLLDTLMFAINADYSAIKNRLGSYELNIFNENDGSPSLTRPLIVRNEVYSLSVSLLTRTPQNALGALQDMHALIVHDMLSELEYDEFLKKLTNEIYTLLTRLMEKYKSASLRLTDLKIAKKGMSKLALREQQIQLCDLMTRKAALIMSGDLHRDNAKDLGEEIIEIGSAEDGFPYLLQIMHALANDDPVSTVNAATAVTQMKLNQTHYLQDNKWPVLQACTRRNMYRHPRVSETTLNRQKEQPGNKAVDAALEDMYVARWIGLLRHVEHGNPTLTAYDNMVQQMASHSAQRVGKMVKPQNSTFL